MTETIASSIAVSSEALATPPLSQVERVVDTFIAPSKTFTDILQKPKLVAPVLA